MAKTHVLFAPQPVVGRHGEDERCPGGGYPRQLAHSALVVAHVLEDVGRREEVEAPSLERDLVHRSLAHVLKAAAAAVGDRIRGRIEPLRGAETRVEL